MTTHNYSKIRLLFLRLFHELEDSFSETEVLEIKDYFDVGEFGLAYETFKAICDQEGRNIPSAAELVAREIGALMSYS